MTQKITISGKTIFLTSDTLKAKCVPEMISIHLAFSEKALKYEANHGRINDLKKCFPLGFDEKKEFNSLRIENSKIRPYLEKNITEYKRNRQEWVFENVESTKAPLVEVLA